MSLRRGNSANATPKAAKSREGFRGRKSNIQNSSKYLLSDNALVTNEKSPCTVTWCNVMLVKRQSGARAITVARSDASISRGLPDTSLASDPSSDVAMGAKQTFKWQEVIHRLEAFPEAKRLFRLFSFLSPFEHF